MLRRRVVLASGSLLVAAGVALPLVLVLAHGPDPAGPGSPAPPEDGVVLTLDPDPVPGAPESSTPPRDPEAPPGSGDLAGVPVDLARRGLGADLVRTARRVSVRTGVAPAAGARFAPARLAVAVCERVAGGRTTWDDETVESILSGVAADGAAAWASFLRDDFCPALD